MNILKSAVGFLAALLLLQIPVVAAPPSEVDEQVRAVLESLQPRQGKVEIEAADAVLDLGDDYLFFGPDDARQILTRLWGNPPQSVEGVLGLVMQAGTSPLSDSWGAVITYEDSGYVSDDDAADVDFAELLDQMREGENERNEQRQSAGFPTLHLVGWAEQPKYDKATHSVAWAQNIKFESDTVNTLNYDLRTLGRRGVLSVNFVSTMPNLPEIKTAAQNFATHAAFTPGARYEDFDPSSDRKAEYGIGGLIAAGVGVAAAKKLGLFAVLLKFLKPLLLGVVIVFAALRNKIMGLFRRDTPDEY